MEMYKAENKGGCLLSDGVLHKSVAPAFVW